MILSVTDSIGPFWLFLFFHDREVYSVSVWGSKGTRSRENTANMFVILLNLSILSTLSLSPTILSRTLLFPCISVSKDCIFCRGWYPRCVFRPFWPLLKLFPTVLRAKVLGTGWCDGHTAPVDKNQYIKAAFFSLSVLVCKHFQSHSGVEGRNCWKIKIIQDFDQPHRVLGARDVFSETQYFQMCFSKYWHSKICPSNRKLPSLLILVINLIISPVAPLVRLPLKTRCQNNSISWTFRKL